MESYGRGKNYIRKSIDESEIQESKPPKVFDVVLL
jgi:hypothetical protein